MAIFTLRVVNSDFEASDDLEAADYSAAVTEALRAALAIGTEEVCKGKPFFGGEVSIECDGQRRQRFLVSIGQSPLK